MAFTHKSLFFDYIIIGAGIIGITIARHLSNNSLNQRIGILERAVAGSGSSLYSAGLHIPYGRNIKVKELSKNSEHQYIDLMNSYSHIPIYPLLFTGLVLKDQYAKLAGNFNITIKEESSTLLLPQSLGTININNNETLFSITKTHYADVPQLIKYYTHSSNFKEKISLWEGIDIKEILDNCDNIKIVLHDKRILYANKVILAPGPWACTDPIFQSLLKPFGIRVKKIVALHIEKKPLINDPGLFFFDHDAFLLPLYKSGYWLFSYSCQEWDVLPNALNLNITQEDRCIALNILSKYCPDLVDYATSGRVFCDAYSPDRSPIISKIINNHRIIFAGATNGSGYRIAPGVAKEVLNLVTTDKV